MDHWLHFQLEYYAHISTYISILIYTQPLKPLGAQSIHKQITLRLGTDWMEWDWIGLNISKEVFLHVKQHNLNFWKLDQGQG